ncbi:hypothetical protein, partial [Chitinophaga sp.]|uniref:hypothetical protein n=1 Tax=Chitinophaga sp. TaxID=1869181 RepID=UPI002F9375F7
SIRDISHIEITDQNKLTVNKNGLSGGHILGYSGSIDSYHHGRINLYSNAIEQEFLMICFSIDADPIIICPAARHLFLSEIKTKSPTLPAILL